MDYMAGTLSPEQMVQQQMLMEALRAPQTQTSALNTASPGVQMPKSNGMNQFVSNALGGAAKGALSAVGTGGGVPGGTADFVPYSW